MTLLLALLRVENEDNAVLCMKIIIDLHRTYSRPLPTAANPDGTPGPEAAPSVIEASVDEFLEIVADLFRGMAAVVEETFSASTPGASDPAPSPAATLDEGPGPQQPAAPVILAPAMKSFKLLQDCPAAIVFIFQTYRTMVNKAISVFVPLVFEVCDFLARVGNRELIVFRARRYFNSRRRRKRGSTRRWSPASRGSASATRSQSRSAASSRTWSPPRPRCVL